MELNHPRILNIVKFADLRGNLSVLENPSTLPFEIARAYWIHGVPAGGTRHGHAYYSSQELIIALSGSFDVITDSAAGTKQFTLSRADCGLYLPPLTWREIYNTSTNSVALIVSSTLYDELDYIRDLSEFKQIIDNEHR